MLRARWPSVVRLTLSVVQRQFYDPTLIDPLLVIYSGSAGMSGTWSGRAW